MTAVAQLRSCAAGLCGRRKLPSGCVSEVAAGSVFVYSNPPFNSVRFFSIFIKRRPWPEGFMW